MPAWARDARPDQTHSGTTASGVGPARWRDPVRPGGRVFGEGGKAERDRVNDLEIAACLAERAEIETDDAEAIVATVINIITSALARGEEVHLADFGTFGVADPADPTWRNPGTWRWLRGPPTLEPTFRADKPLCDAVTPQDEW